LNGRSITAAPADRAATPVSSVDPSFTTTTVAPGRAAPTSRTTVAIVFSSL